MWYKAPEQGCSFAGGNRPEKLIAYFIRNINTPYIRDGICQNWCFKTYWVGSFALRTFSRSFLHYLHVHKTPAQAFTPPADEKKVGTIWIFGYYGSGRGQMQIFFCLKVGKGLGLFTIYIKNPSGCKLQMERKNFDWKIPFGARAFHFPYDRKKP